MDAFEGTIEIENVENTNILEITLQANSPQVAFDEMRSVIENHRTVSESIMGNAVIDVLKAPTVPTKPLKQLDRPGQVVKYSLLAGAAVIAVIIVFSIVSDQIMTEKDLENRVDCPALATIYHERKNLSLRAKLLGVKTSMLITNPTTSFRFAETYRLFRTRLEYIMKQKDYKVLMISSVYENEGKTTCAANTAITLALNNKKVLLMDGDMLKPALYKVMGTRVKRGKAVNEVITSDMPFEDIPVNENVPTLSLLMGRSSISNSTEVIASNEMRDFIAKAKEYFDYVVIDTPPMALASDAECFAELADCMMIIVKQGGARAKRINECLEAVSRSGAEILGCLFNNVYPLELLSAPSADIKTRQTYRTSAGYGEPAGGYARGYASEAPSGGERYERQEHAESMRPLREEARGGYADMRQEQPRGEIRQREQEETPVHSETANISPRGLADYFNEIVATTRRLYLLPIILAVVFSMLLCIRARIAFNPVYQASATFAVDVTNANSKGSASYNVNLAKQLSETFPYIFSSDVLINLIMQDLGLNEIPATITAAAVGETNLFTLNVYSRTPQMSYNILRSAINNYPRVADSVIGNTTLNVISDSGLSGKPTNAISYKTELLKGMALGLLLAFIIIIILTFTKTTVRDADDLKTMLNLRCLSTVPYIGRRRRGEGETIEIADPDMSKSFSDSVRLLRSRTERICAENDYRVILVASSMPGEGKTTVATNLAMSLAMSGRKVALLDCDLRKPSTMGKLTSQKEHGISEYLNGLVKLDDIINEPAENIIVLSGKIPSDDAAELLGSAKMKELLDELLERVELIVLDSPPASVIADAVVLSNLSDCVVYVIRQEYTRKSRILDGLNHLSNGKAVFLGYVLNNGTGSGGGYGYGYGAYGKYSRYGRYSRYSKYSRYSRYGRYGRYGKYGSYSRYGRYSRYSTYSRYGSYSRYRTGGNKKK